MGSRDPDSSSFSATDELMVLGRSLPRSGPYISFLKKEEVSSEQPFPHRGAQTTAVLFGI